MNADGTAAKPLIKEKRFMFGSPTWSPDGQYIVARRWGQYPNQSYLRATQLWMSTLVDVTQASPLPPGPPD